MSDDVRQTWHSIYLFVYLPIPGMFTLPISDAHHHWHCLIKNTDLCDTEHGTGYLLSLHTPLSLPFSIFLCGFHLFTWHLPRSSLFYCMFLYTAELTCPAKFFLSFTGFTKFHQKAEITFAALLYFSVFSVLENKLLPFLPKVFPSLFLQHHKNIPFGI